MKFKKPELQHELQSCSIFLWDMAEKFDQFSKMVAGQEAIITRVKEFVAGSSGVHEDGRAFDVRDEFEGGRLYTDEQVKQIIQYMNEYYPRNDGKPTCLSHSFNGGPIHFHVQLALTTGTYAIEVKDEKSSQN